MVQMVSAKTFCRILTANKMQIGFMPEELLTLCLSREGCKKSIMLQGQVAYVFCGPRDGF